MKDDPPAAKTDEDIATPAKTPRRSTKRERASDSQVSQSTTTHKRVSSKNSKKKTPIKIDLDTTDSPKVKIPRISGGGSSEVETLLHQQIASLQVELADLRKDYKEASEALSISKMDAERWKAKVEGARSEGILQGYREGMGIKTPLPTPAPSHN